jgi:hypothetical protein
MAAAAAASRPLHVSVMTFFVVQAKEAILPLKFTYRTNTAALL